MAVSVPRLSDEQVSILFTVEIVVSKKQTMRPVSPSIPDDGLLVGWSLEGQRRQKVLGFANTESINSAPSQHLEPILCTDEGHLITVAPTGSGKGVGCIVPALLRYQGPVIVIDPKGENYRVTARRRRELGQKLVVLDPFKITDAPENELGRLNPLDFLSLDNASLVEDAEMIATTLVAAVGSQHRDPFWPYMGGQLITLMLLYQLKCLSSDKWNLAETRALLSQSPEALKKIGRELADHRDPALSSLAGLVLNPAENTFGGYWSFAQMQTACLKGDQIAEATSSSSFSLQEVLDGDPLSIYLVIPPDKLESHGSLLKVWLTVLMAVITQRKNKPPVSTLFIVDEAAQLGPMPQLRRAITLLRGYGVRVWSFWQDLSQLKGLYPQTWETLLNNCQVQQYFAQSTRIACAQTYEVTGLGSPEYLQSLNKNEMVLSVSGDQAVVAKVPSYLRDPAFKGTFDANPFYLQKEAGNEEAVQRVYRRSAVAENHRSPKVPLGNLSRALRFHPINRIKWRSVKTRKHEVLKRIRAEYLGLENFDDQHIALRTWSPSFYPGYTYYQLTAAPGAGEAVRHCYFLISKTDILYLSGDAGVLFELNRRLPLKLKRDEVIAYLYLYCANTVSTDGRFLVIDEPPDLTFTHEVAEEYQNEVTSQIIQPFITKHTGKPHDENEQVTQYDVTATVLYGNSLFLSTFTVGADGVTSMIDDELLMTDLPVLSDAKLLDYELVLSRK